MPESSRTRLGWWLPPLLAVLAITFQYTFDVPQALMLERPTAEEKAAKAKAKRAKKRAQKAKKNKKARKKAGKTARKGVWTPRGDEEVARLRRTYSTQPFDDEPRDAVFRRHHEALLRSAATKLRAAVVGKGVPVSMQIRPQCRTLRCELELCAKEELLGEVAVLLPDLRVNKDEPLWHELRELPARPRTSKTGGPRDYSCRRWLVDFAHEDLTTRKISLLEHSDEAE